MSLATQIAATEAIVPPVVGEIGPLVRLARISADLIDGGSEEQQKQFCSAVLGLADVVAQGLIFGRELLIVGPEGIGGPGTRYLAQSPSRSNAMLALRRIGHGSDGHVTDQLFTEQAFSESGCSTNVRLCQQLLRDLERIHDLDD